MTAVPPVIESVSQDVLVRATERALRAPSVHNTQPWHWQVSADAVRLWADRDRQLAGTDPDGRDLLISCGAALHHLRAALAEAGVATTTERLPDPEDRLLLAVVRVVDGPPDSRTAALASAIADRRSDRRDFAHEPAHPAQLRLLSDRAATEGANLVAVVGDDARARLAAVLGQAATLERVVPGYAAELAIWTGRNVGSHDGIPIGSLTARADGAGTNGLRTFRSGSLRQTPHSPATHQDGATMMVLTTVGDSRLDWLRAGEATSAALLVATRIGLATTMLSQATEVDETRRQLAVSVLQVPEYAQLVLRVGLAPAGAAALPASPRRPLAAVLLRTRDTSA